MEYKSILRLLLKHLPLKKEIVFFSFSGQYCDNPLYISQEVHALHPKYDIVWLISEASREAERLPEYIKVVPYGSLKALIHLCQAKVIVDNYAGLYFGYCNRTLLPFYMQLKKRRQFNISTWHGTPLKKIGIDSFKGRKDLLFFSSTDIIVAGNQYEKKIFSTAFSKDVPTVVIGSPRDDILLNSGISKSESLAVLGLSEQFKYVIYAPTFRDYEKKFTQANQINLLDQININQLMNALETRFGGEWRLIARGHQMVQKHICRESCLDERVIDGNEHDDMSLYLNACDVLITDYSSSMFDFLLTEKPCFLFVPDKDYYISQDRGVYMDMDSLPFDQCKTNGELTNAIRDYNEQLMLNKRDIFRQKLGYPMTDKSSETVVKIIDEVLKSSPRQYAKIVDKYIHRIG